MKSIAFHLQKGGVGKTTLSGNTAHEMKFHRKTILVDCDPQGNLTSWMVEGDRIRFDLADVLQGKAKIDDAILELRKNFYILPTIAIDGALKDWTASHQVEADRAFEYLLKDLDHAGFEVAVFDLGPGMSNLEKSVLSLMDEIVPVVSAEFFGMDGIEIFESELSKLRTSRRANFKADKLIVNRLNKAYSSHKIYDGVYSKTKYEIYRIGQTTALSDCVPAHKVLAEFEPGNRYTTEIQRLANDLLGLTHGKI